MDQNRNENFVKISAQCPEIFVASWGIFGLSGDLVNIILNREAYRKLHSVQEAPRKVKKISGQKSWQYFKLLLVQTMTPISKLTDHYHAHIACFAELV